jgi:hypothetical protein
MVYQNKITNTLSYLIFFNLAFYIVLFQVQNVNIFWIVNNAFLNFVILIFNKKFTLKIISLFLFTSISLFFCFFYPVVKFSSFTLTIFLILSAAIQINYLFYNINNRVYTKILINIFYIFLITYFFQCLCVFFHFPIFNGFGLTKENTSIFRLNAFSPEPSMASQLILLIMYLVNTIKFFKKNEALIFELISVFLIILFGSVFGYISLLIYIFTIHKRFNLKLFKLELITGSIFIIYFLKTSETLSRISSLLNYMWTDFDIDKLASIESSGSFRFYPLFFYIKNFNFNNIYYFIGFGPGVSSTFFNEGLIARGFGLELDSNFQGGFIPAFLIDYGLILTFILLYFIIKYCIIKQNIFEYSFLFLLLMNTNINTQLFWFYIFSTFFAKILFFRKTYSSLQFLHE